MASRYPGAKRSAGRNDRMAWVASAVVGNGNTAQDIPPVRFASGRLRLQGVLACFSVISVSVCPAPK